MYRMQVASHCIVIGANSWTIDAKTRSSNGRIENEQNMIQRKWFNQKIQTIDSFKSNCRCGALNKHRNCRQLFRCMCDAEHSWVNKCFCAVSARKHETKSQLVVQQNHCNTEHLANFNQADWHQSLLSLVILVRMPNVANRSMLKIKSTPKLPLRTEASTRTLLLTFISFSMKQVFELACDSWNGAVLILRKTWAKERNRQQKLQRWAILLKYQVSLWKKIDIAKQTRCKVFRYMHHFAIFSFAFFDWKPLWKLSDWNVHELNRTCTNDCLFPNLHANFDLYSCERERLSKLLLFWNGQTNSIR